MRDNDGWTAFMWACLKGHKDVVRLLLYHSNPNIELNARNNGDTPFIMAGFNGHKDVVQLLLEYSDTIDLSGFDDLPQEMRDFTELHLEASKELKRFNEIHQAKRRK